MTSESTLKEAVATLLKRGVLISPDVLRGINDSVTIEELENSIQEREGVYYLDEIKTQEKPTLDTSPYTVEIKKNYDKEPKEKDVQGFVKYYKIRYKNFQEMLATRQELNNLTSIHRLEGKRDGESFSIIGMVLDKQKSKNGNILLTLDDPTGQTTVFIPKDRREIFPIANDLVVDEIIGVVGKKGRSMVYADNIVLPDIPLTKELKKGPDDVYAVFISDLHVGSEHFLHTEFKNFLRWIKGDTGTPEQVELAKKVGYLFVIGDIVAGVGIYPNQEHDLHIKDIYEQYQACAKLLQEVPTHIKIIICPGNHDAVRLAEPQPMLPKHICQPLWEMPNVVMVSNPATVNIHRTATFPGFNVLVYHGYSLIYFANNVEKIRESGGTENSGPLMSHILQRRHLSPSHFSSLQVPDLEEDHLFIKDVPDFLITGHLHKSSISSYRNVTLICGSCWESQTPFEAKMGIIPEPGRVPLVNLKTRQPRIMKFD